jgi:hypothetical protein
MPEARCTVRFMAIIAGAGFWQSSSARARAHWGKSLLTHRGGKLKG